MATALTPSVSPPEPPRKRWTRDECRRLMELGILPEARFELIHGDIALKMTQHERHIFTRKQVQKALESIFGADHVRMAAPIAIGDHEEPEPDAAVVIRTPREYLQRGTPLPEDVRLAVEVSDNTLHTDLNVKTGQYGPVGIADYRVIDVKVRMLHVFRQPTAEGYASETVLGAGQSVSPLAAPDNPIPVADLLP